ncbi:ATP synthase delta chain [Serinicoccus hydrothermalis]|uniref:ATP synthase subunit delta n=1 Tax=Serinicoccus hydrothermalis TaxID=1758689 RepID=A0A1B1NB42_9MICO|nr:F0F1 ATP synthase subunit delta [Serinicoccus hydrothermalis]ANS78647.1 ATP synthase delta chain [Serinicoccus hydrothermalis]
MDSAYRRSLHGAREGLHEVLEHDGGSVDPARVGEDLWALARLVDGNAVLARTLADPSREGSERAAITERLLSGKIGDGALHAAKATVSQRWSGVTDLATALERVSVEAQLVHAQRAGRLDQVEDELFRFSRIVESTPDLQSALGDRRAPVAAKRSLVERLLSVKAAPETVTLAAQAAVGVRGARVERTLVAYLEQAAELQDQVTAVVTTAIPLRPEQEESLRSTLSRQYGRTVHTNVVIDPDVVGGIRVEIGDEVIDGTVSHRLDQARRLMAG